MKKLFTVTALLLVLCLCLAACGGKSKNPDTLTPDEPTSLTPDEPQAPTSQVQTPEEEIERNTSLLLPEGEPLVEMEAVKREMYDNGSYYYMDVAGENALRSISSCYRNTIREGETEEEYAQRRAIGMSMTLSPGNPYNLTVGKSDDLSEKLGLPVYLVSFLTGSDLNATCWTIYLTRTEHYSYQYALCAASQTSLQLEDKIMDHFSTIQLKPMPLP